MTLSEQIPLILVNNTKKRDYNGWVIHRDQGGIVATMLHYKEGKNHNEDGPAIIHFNSSGNVWKVTYRLNGMNHRTDGPSEIEFSTSIPVKDLDTALLNYEKESSLLIYYDDGVIHRDDGPAVINKNTGNEKVVYYQYGLIHREEGPAIIYREEGKISLKQFFINGKKMDLRDIERMKRQKIKYKLKAL